MAQGAPGGGSQPGAQQGSFGGASNSPFGNNGSTNANGRMSASDPNAVVMAMDASTTQASLQSGLQLGPPERWWDEKKFRKMLELTPDQQRQLDAIFNANKSSILLPTSASQCLPPRAPMVPKKSSLSSSQIMLNMIWQFKELQIKQASVQMERISLSKLESLLWKKIQLVA